MGTTTVTVSVRKLVITAAAALAVLAAYLVGSAQTSPSAAAAAARPAAADVSNIVMTGTGEAVGIPDQLTFSLAVRTSADDVSTALVSASSTTRDVLAAVRAQHVAPKDVQTTGLSINPTYDHSGDGPPRITGYAVTESMSVLVRQLGSAGTTISAAVEAGGNAVRLHGVQLRIDDEDALMRQARADAFAQARAKAEQYAAAGGRRLGEVSSIREVNVTPTTELAYRSSAFAATAAESVPIRAGSADLHVTVSVTWSLA